MILPACIMMLHFLSNQYTIQWHIAFVVQWNLSITDLRIKDTSVIRTADEGPER